jgi:protease II
VVISEQYNLLVYGVDYEGDEQYEVRIIDLTTLEHKSDIIPVANTSVCDFIWHKKIEGFL